MSRLCITSAAAAGKQTPPGAWAAGRQGAPDNHSQARTCTRHRWPRWPWPAPASSAACPGRRSWHTHLSPRRTWGGEGMGVRRQRRSRSAPVCKQKLTSGAAARRQWQRGRHGCTQRAGPCSSRAGLLVSTNTHRSYAACSSEPCQSLRCAPVPAPAAQPSCSAICLASASSSGVDRMLVPASDGMTRLVAAVGRMVDGGRVEWERRPAGAASGAAGLSPHWCGCRGRPNVAHWHLRTPHGRLKLLGGAAGTGRAASAAAGAGPGCTQPQRWP